MEPLGRCRHYFLPREPEKLTQHLGQNLRHKSRERMGNGEESFDEEGALWSRSLLPLHLPSRNHTQGASLAREREMLFTRAATEPYITLRSSLGQAKTSDALGWFSLGSPLSRRALGDEDVSQWQSTCPRVHGPEFNP